LERTKAKTACKRVHEEVRSVSAESDLRHEALRRRAQRLTRTSKILTPAGFALWLGGVVLVFARASPWWVGIADFFALPLILFLAGLVEKRANGLRAAYVAGVARQDPRPPLLVLRSFSQPVLTEARPIDHIRGFAKKRGTTLLWQLSEAAAPIARLLAIGEPPARQGLLAPETLFIATTDETWFEVFRVAARACRAAVAIPDISGGVAREIRAIRQLGLADKLLILMPPSETPPPSWTPFRTRDPEALAARWSIVQEEWKKEGYQLPAYDEAGMLYRAAPDLSASEAVGLERFASIPAIREALDRLLPPATGNCASLAATLEDLDRLGAHVLSGRGAGEFARSR